MRQDSAVPLAAPGPPLLLRASRVTSLRPGMFLLPFSSMQREILPSSREGPNHSTTREFSMDHFCGCVRPILKVFIDFVKSYCFCVLYFGFWALRQVES